MHPCSLQRSLLAAFLPLACANAVAITYHVTDITPPGVTDGTCIALNDRGDAIGRGDGRLFLRSAAGKVHSIKESTGPYVKTALPARMNDSGLVVGAVEMDPVFHSTKPVAWQPGGKPQWLPTLGGYDGRAAGINAAGDMVGTTSDASGDHATLWHDGQPVDLVPGSMYSSASDINDRGQVAGSVGLSPALIESGHATVLATWGYTYAINAAGHVAGQTSSEDKAVAALWRDGQQLELGALGAGNSFAADLNDDDVVVGATSSVPVSTWVAFVWRDGLMQALDDLVPSEERGGYSVQDASAINNAGVICATEVSSHGRVSKALLLTPAP